MSGQRSTDIELDLVTIEPGTFAMGSLSFYPEESPVFQRSVERFAIGRAPVTNSEFRAFVTATGFQTTAERPLDSRDFPDVPGGDRTAGSLVFTMTDGPVDLGDWRQWWAWVQGASWRAPFGPGSTIEGLDEHPVVQVSHDDAEAFCSWAGVRLPTEVEWEYASRGGLEGATYSWGDEPQHVGELKANTWQGRFPWQNTGARGWRGTSPVGTFASNAFGLVDTTGNVWEWTSSPWSDRHEISTSCGCSPNVALMSTQAWVAKGGSHLCAPDYCLRYRPAARTCQSQDSATTHMGFRVAANG